jgi:type I restriction enzyme S subunit
MKIGSGATPLGGEAAYKASGISLIRSLNVHDSGFKHKDLAFIDDVQAELLSNVNVEPNDVLLNITGASVARCCTVPDSVLPARVNQHVSILRPINQVIHSRFLHYLLISPQVKARLLRAGDAGSTRQALTKGLLQEFHVEFPTSLKEQERIVAILNDAFEGIAAARANIEKKLIRTNELLDVELQLLLTSCRDGWKSLTLAEVASDYGRGKSKHRPRNDPKLYGGAYPFVQTGDVRSAKQYVTSYSQTYNDVGLSQSKLWPKGTLCVTIAANIAETAILDFDACFPDSVIGIVANPSKANTRFIEYQLRVAKAQLQAKGKGSAQDNINLGTFETHTFSFPPLSVQDALVERLDSIALLSASLTDVIQHTTPGRWPSALPTPRTATRSTVWTWALRPFRSQPA